MIYFEKIKEGYSVYADSPFDVFESIPKNKDNMNLYHSIKNRHDAKWVSYALPDYDSCINSFLYGDQRVTDIVLPRVSSIFEKIDIDAFKTEKLRTRRKRVKGAFGSELDIHAVYQGRIDKAWDSTQKIEQEFRTDLVTLVVDVGGLAGVESNSSYWIGATVIACMRILEIQGKNVEIIICSAAEQIFQNEHGYLTNCVVLKKYNEFFSEEKIAGACNITYHRIFNFMTRCFSEKTISTGFGSTVPIKFAVPKNLQDLHNEGKARLIILDRALSLGQAIESIERATGLGKAPPIL